ncbi:S9 family peptidase [Novosphingobium sp. B 225]|uniref:S9 family peptidase n=1 Tax=Novosphingobium sp. B 225 TaxID=1961849 RepID=UPI000B4AF99A|nr:DPP IV N-terminal domain-containing protein [Novosphingobium sp. B 225]
MHLRHALFLPLLALSPLAYTQEAQVSAEAAVPDAAPSVLTLERVFASPGLNGPVPRGVKLSPDGRYLTVLRNRPDDRERYDLWGFDRKSSKWSMLVDSLKLGSGKNLSEAEKMQRERQRIGDLKGIVSYEWAADGKAVLVPLDGDLFLAGLDGTVRKLSDSSADELNPALSPKGGYVSFVRDRQLWVGQPGGKVAPITPADTRETVHWGEAEFVAQEEMARFTGYWWAPDDGRIAVQRFDDAPVGVVTRAAIGADGTRTFQQRYPVAGSPNSLVSLHVMLPDGSDRVEVDLGPDQDIYLARVDWAPDGKTLFVQRQNRAQTRLDILSVDPVTGKSRVLFAEDSAPQSWINLSDSYRLLKDGSLIWWSERDGFGHLWHFKAGQWTQLTKGAWVVSKLVGVDETKGKLFFLGNHDDPLAMQIYAMDLAKPGTITALGESGFSHTASMDKDGKTMLVTRSSPGQPPQTYIADPAGKRLAWVEENRLDPKHPYYPHLASHRAPQFGTVKASDGTVLHWKMISPVMEPGKRYPVFFEHYGGPTAQKVTRSWTGALEQALVDKGYIYFELDNRGSENRGVAFASALYRAMGGIEVQDQKAGAEYLKSLPFVDPAKIATYGWSYGGYMTLKMLQADPGLYAAGIAGAPVTKWELYDTHYTERYMGTPQADGAAYAKSSALTDSAKVKDPLLIIHGMADDNVVFENSSALIAKMQAEAVPFEMMLYPGYTHRVSGPKVGRHLWESILAFLERHGVTPPR